MMTKNEIKLLRAFLIETHTTQKEFAKEAGISERTLRTAIKTGKISEKTWMKILDEIIAETIQIDLIKCPEQKNDKIIVPNYLYNTVKICWFFVGIFSMFILINIILK